MEFNRSTNVPRCAFFVQKKKIDGRDEFQAVISLFCATFNRESAESLIISFIL